MANLYEMARQIFPKLPSDVAYQEKFGAGTNGNMLEFYPKGESQSFDPTRPAVQVYDPNARPEDIAADIVSHQMVNSDPVVSQIYNKFLMSMQPWQQKILQEQYQWAVKNANESRPFSDWARVSGEPAYLRGYAFGQWPSSFTSKAYTPDQKKLLNGLIQYLRSPQ